MRRLASADPDFTRDFAVLLADRDAPADVGAAVAAILADVRRDGDAALLAHTARLDRLDLTAERLRVTPAEMVATARAHLPDQVQGREVLVIQDTTSLRDDGNKCGLHLHPAIAVDAADGALSGLLSADLLVRDETPEAHCNRRRLEDKESRWWVDATVRTADLLTAGASRAMAIADREADLYEMFACRPEGVDVLVRANHNRALADGGWLGESCDNEPELWAARRSNCRLLPAVRRAWHTLRRAPGASTSSGRSAIVHTGRRRWRPVSV